MRSSQHAFSLIELLVVVTILAILFALLCPVIAVVRTQARDLHCLSNLRQLGAITLLRAVDRKFIWQSCMDYNATGVMAERIHRFRNDDPASRFGGWGSAQTEHQINLPELCDYVDGGPAQFRKDRTIQCPSSAFIANLDVPSDVNDYWYKEMFIPYVYTGWVSRWYDSSGTGQATNAPERFCDRTGGGDRLLWSDFVFRWTGGTNNGHPQPPWSVNHSPETWQKSWYGTPPIRSVNQCYGDGRVQRKGKQDFDAAAMDGMSDDATKVTWIRSAGSWNDRRFF